MRKLVSEIVQEIGAEIIPGMEFDTDGDGSTIKVMEVNVMECTECGGPVDRYRYHIECRDCGSIGEDPNVLEVNGFFKVDRRMK